MSKLQILVIFVTLISNVLTCVIPTDFRAFDNLGNTIVAVTTVTSPFNIECIGDDEVTDFNGVDYAYFKKITCVETSVTTTELKMEDGKTTLDLSSLGCVVSTTLCDASTINEETIVPNKKVFPKYVRNESVMVHCVNFELYGFEIKCSTDSAESSKFTTLQNGATVDVDANYCKEVNHVCTDTYVPTDYRLLSAEVIPDKITNDKVFYTECVGDRKMMSLPTPMDVEDNYVQSVCINKEIVSNETVSARITDFTCVEDATACVAKDLPTGLQMANMSMFVKFLDLSTTIVECVNKTEKEYTIACSNAVWKNASNLNATVNEEMVNEMCKDANKVIGLKAFGILFNVAILLM